MKVSRAPRPNTKGWTAPWRRGWGPLSDGRSKLARLAKKIEEEMVAEYRPLTPHQRRQVRRAAILEALAEATGAQLGSDPKATRRTLTALEKTAESKLAALRARRNGHGEDGPFDLAVELARQRSVP